jgi:SMODS-associated and fused to various effectors sensor domain
MSNDKPEKRKEAGTSVRRVVWARAAGRCQFPGCNEPLWHDYLTGKENANFGFIAHIIAAKPSGPRGDKALSPKLGSDVTNLMLMCYKHHHEIDTQKNVDGEFTYTVDELRGYKRDHEQRIELLTALSDERSTEIVLYGANIGGVTSPISFQSTKDAVLPTRFPRNFSGTSIGLGNSSFQDHQSKYWDFEIQNLEKNFERLVRPLIADDTVPHLSIFGLAPQPLLIKLGSLLTDIQKAEVFQLHREPSTWNWLAETDGFDLNIGRPSETKKHVALKIGISADVNDGRIYKALGTNEVSIWSLEAKNVNPGLKRGHIPA